MLRIGGPVHTGEKDPARLAAKHRELGYRAAYCPEVALDDGDGIKAIREAFATADVVIAEVGAWVNLLDPDPGKRRANLDYVCSRLALADEVGALCCVDIVGSFNPDRWDGPHPDNLGSLCFDAAVENARTIIDTVKPKRAKFTYEMMPHTLPDSAQSFLDLMGAVDRDAFGVHLDPVNIVNSPRRYYGNADLLRECFALLGPYIVSCHAKDTIISPELTVEIKEARPGLGNLDYGVYLRELAALPHKPPLMLEHLPNEEEYGLARSYVFGVAEALGMGI